MMVAPATRQRTILVVEDDDAVRFALTAALRRRGYATLEASSITEASRRLREGSPHAIVSDLHLADGDAFALLADVRAAQLEVPIFIVTGYGTIDVAVRAVKEGAEDFLTKPIDLERLTRLVEAAVSRRVERSATNPILGAAAARLEADLAQLRDVDCSVLILGETGTGKSTLARRIHQVGARSSGPFVDVNCAGLTRELVESELFGYERGAFTGAHASKAGLLDAADGGTLFLDEVGDVDVQVQPKLLKVLEEKRFRRLGDVRERAVDVRLVAATHHDLLAASERGTFRADLYYRISTVTLTVPALRERPEDIVPIAQKLLAELDPRAELTPHAEEKLHEHKWPGNIRELRNVLERALLWRTGPSVDAADLRFDITRTNLGLVPRRDPLPSPPPPTNDPGSGSRLLAAGAKGATRTEVEREHIRLTLEAEDGRVEAAARRLGMSRSTLYQKLKDYGIRATRTWRTLK